MQRKLTVAITLIIVIAALMMTAFGCAGSSIDVRELVSIQVTGANGYGTLEVKTNRERTQAMVREKMDVLKDGDEKGLKRAFMYEAALATLSYSAETTSALRNGDTVEIYASYDEALAKAAGIRFKNKSFVYTVRDLSEAARIQVEESVSLTFTGYNGFGEAELAISGEMQHFKDDFAFDFLSPSTKLSNGDVVKLRVVPDNRALTSAGRIAAETTLNFKVEGLPELKTVDPFENLVLMFIGVSDDGTISFDTTRLPADWVEQRTSAKPPLRFIAEPNDLLANGDSVMIRCEIDETWFAEHGVKISPITKTVEVKGLKEYPRNLDGIDLMPLFKAIEKPMEEDIALRLKQNYWNEDASAGEPLSVWNYEETHGVTRVFYGYHEKDRADNFVAIFMKIKVKGKCVSVEPYKSTVSPGQQKEATLYLIYVVENIMYDRSSIDDFRSFGLKGHSDAEHNAVAAFRDDWVVSDDGVQLVEVKVPADVAWSDRKTSRR
ncbi:MAG: hypothetical protein ACOX36_00255 [Saccharofermentanales bacterium]|jgi:hypothetical protein